MDPAALATLVDHLVQDSAAASDSVEIVRARQVGDRLIVLARWTDVQTGRFRRGAVDLSIRDGVWRANGGWGSNADFDADHPVWRAWGASGRSTSGWVADPRGATVRLREPAGRVEEDTVEDGVAILVHDPAFARGSVVEVLDKHGAVLHAAPMQAG